MKNDTGKDRHKLRCLMIPGDSVDCPWRVDVRQWEFDYMESLLDVFKTVVSSCYL